jgi:uncharacterized membrane protein
MEGNDFMKKQNLLVELTLLLAVLLTVGATDAQVARRFDRVGRPGGDSILARPHSTAQQNPALVSSAHPAPPQVQYMLIDLGGRRAIDISESGEIVGTKYSSPERFHAAYWSGSQSAPIDLGTLFGLNSGSVAINSRREMVGNAFSDDQSVNRPLFWASPGSGPVELPGRPASLQGGTFDINPSGQIVGWFYSSDNSVQRAVYWPRNNAAPVYLRPLSAALPFSAATSINASGKIHGDSCSADFSECHAVFWARSTSNPVALASPGGDFIYTDIVPGPSINNAGRMVGLTYNADGSVVRAVYWASSSSPAMILSTVCDFTNTFAAGINDNGQIVGFGYDQDFARERPILWLCATSPAIDLSTFFPAGSSWDLDTLFASAVNNRGEIIGNGFKDGALHDFVLVPVHGH